LAKEKLEMLLEEQRENAVADVNMVEEVRLEHEQGREEEKAPEKGQETVQEIAQEEVQEEAPEEAEPMEFNGGKGDAGETETKETKPLIDSFDSHHDQSATITTEEIIEPSSLLPDSQNDIIMTSFSVQSNPDFGGGASFYGQAGNGASAGLSDWDDEEEEYDQLQDSSDEDEEPVTVAKTNKDRNGARKVIEESSQEDENGVKSLGVTPTTTSNLLRPTIGHEMGRRQVMVAVEVITNEVSPYQQVLQLQERQKRARQQEAGQAEQGSSTTSKEQNPRTARKKMRPVVPQGPSVMHLEEPDELKRFYFAVKSQHPCPECDAIDNSNLSGGIKQFRLTCKSCHMKSGKKTLKKLWTSMLQQGTITVTEAMKTFIEDLPASEEVQAARGVPNIDRLQVLADKHGLERMVVERYVAELKGDFTLADTLLGIPK
jgi:hypothetical protein